MDDFTKEAFMARKSLTNTTKPRKRAPKRVAERAISPIPEPFQVVEASTVTAGTTTVKVPTLVLRGEWLKAIGFPINAGLYLTTDRRGEMTLHRLGLGLPRRLRIVAVKP
jgi:hypothetical protein